MNIPDNQERDISRAEGNLEVIGDVKPNTFQLDAVYNHSLIINPSLGMYQEIHPYRAISIGSIKINTSLRMRREWITTSRFPSNLWDVQPNTYIPPLKAGYDHSFINTSLLKYNQTNPIHPSTQGSVLCCAILSSYSIPGHPSGTGNRKNTPTAGN